MKVNKFFKELFIDDYTIEYKVLLGGAGSGKSYAVAQKIVLDFISKPGINTLVLRKFHNTNRRSTFPIISRFLEQYKKLYDIKINESNLTITNMYNKNQIVFLGLQDVERLKSITFLNGDLNRVWLEEASECTIKDFNQINLRMRGKNSNFGHCIYISLNPTSSKHWVKKLFFDVKNKKAWTNHSTYLTNIFAGERERDVLELMKVNDPEYYNIYALGQWGNLSGLIFKDYSIEDFPVDSFENYAIGLDFGWTDETAIVEIAYQNDTIYVCNVYKKNQMTNWDIHKVITESFSSSRIYADNSRPESIAELKLLGCNIESCKKGSGSVIDSIRWIKSKKLVIHSSCNDLIKELSTYCWRVDKSGESTDMPIDIDNHAIDALRYSTQPFRELLLNKISFTPIDYDDGNINSW